MIGMERGKGGKKKEKKTDTGGRRRGKEEMQIGWTGNR